MNHEQRAILIEAVNAASEQMRQAAQTQPRVLTFDVMPHDGAEVRKLRDDARTGALHHVTLIGSFVAWPMRVTRVRKQYRKPVATVTLTEVRQP